MPIGVWQKLKNLFSIFLLVVSGFYVALAFRLPMFSKHIPGSGFFPRVVGITLIVLLIIELIKNVKDEQEDAFSMEHLRLFLLLIATTTVYIFLFNIFGAILSTILFMVAVLFLFNKGKRIQNLVLGISIPIALFILFEVLLNTGLPKGIFETFL